MLFPIIILVVVFILITLYGNIRQEVVLGGGDTALGDNISEVTNNNTCFIVLPNQLFRKTEAVKYPIIYVVEDPVYFTRLKFHKLKLVFHRATMRAYADYLRTKTQNTVKYIEYKDADKLYHSLSVINKVVIYDPVDVFVESKLPKNTQILPTPYFLNSKADLAEYIDEGGAYRHDSSFYPWMRRKYNVLMTKGGKPKGGKFTYDSENRNPFPKSQEEPKKYKPKNNDYISEARQYIDKHFSDNFGDTAHFIYPHTHAEAKSQLRDFIHNRLKLFGKYQDAASSDITFGYHSVISSSLNVGLITPREVLNELNAFLEKNKIPINSTEGFIRQLIGWREYCQLIYRYEGETMRKMNHFNHNRTLKQTWWDSNTTLGPIDDIIKRVNKYAYAHHIERLMWLSAIMLMCGVAPNAVYKWFIEFVSIDAYDWVMVPNIYGMGTFADGGIMMTRPYFSSFAYIEKMSNWDNAKDAEVWNALYYNFIGKNMAKLKQNYYTARWVGNYKRKSASEKKKIKQIADAFINKNTYKS